MDTNTKYKVAIASTLVFVILVSLYYVYSCNCQDSYEFMQTYDDASSSSNYFPVTTGNPVQHSEIQLLNPNNNAINGTAEKYLYTAKDGNVKFRLIIKAVLYQEDSPYNVTLDGKNIGVLTRMPNGYHELTLESLNTSLFNGTNVLIQNATDGLVLQGSF